VIRLLAAAGLAAAALSAAPAAVADPGPFVPGSVADCTGHAVPLDPRVSIQNPLGTLIFQAMLQAMCGAPPP
jgi:hypothetical protein